MKRVYHGRGGGREALTLMEVLTALVILAILSTMIASSFLTLRAKGEHAKCTNNLKGLYVAATAYITDHQSWPQIEGDDVDSKAFAQAWITAFNPYQLGHPNWICPTIQTLLGDPENDVNHPRIDYMATEFDDHPSSPFKYLTHPWFIERGDAHGDGNLVLFANGKIRTLNEIRNDSKTKRLP